MIAPLKTEQLLKLAEQRSAELRKEYAEIISPWPPASGVDGLHGIAVASQFADVSVIGQSESDFDAQIEKNLNEITAIIKGAISDGVSKSTDFRLHDVEIQWLNIPHQESNPLGSKGRFYCFLNAHSKSGAIEGWHQIGVNITNPLPIKAE